MTTREGAIPQGLDEVEAAARAGRGLRNVLPPATGRTYLEIVRENVLTFINITILGLGVALAVLGEPSDALVSIVAGDVVRLEPGDQVVADGRIVAGGPLRASALDRVLGLGS